MSRPSNYLAREIIDRAGGKWTPRNERIIAGWLDLIEDQGNERVALREGWEPPTTDDHGRHVPTHDPDEGGRA